MHRMHSNAYITTMISSPNTKQDPTHFIRQLATVTAVGIDSDCIYNLFSSHLSVPQRCEIDRHLFDQLNSDSGSLHFYGAILSLYFKQTHNGITTVPRRPCGQSTHGTHRQCINRFELHYYYWWQMGPVPKFLQVRTPELCSYGTVTMDTTYRTHTQES